MAETQLITIANVSEYRMIDPKFDENRFNAFVTEIQRVNLRQLLGKALYKAFMDSERNSGIYQDLLDGKEYTLDGNTIEYYGLKPSLCYWWLAIACRESDVFISNHGPITLVNNPQQMFEEAKEKNRIAERFMQTATDYANDVIDYLDEHASDYTLWENTSKTNINNFVSFRI